MATDMQLPAGAGSAHPGSPRPLRRDAERNRQRIIEAAREVFAERGLAATLDDVAHHAGVGVGTVYRRFPSKESLVEAALEGRLEEVEHLVEEALAHERAWDGLVLFLRRTTEMHAVDHGLRDVLLCTSYDRRDLAAVRARIEPLVRSLVDRAHAEGTLRPDADAHDIAVIHLMVSAVARESLRVRPDLHRRYLELLIDGLRGPAAAGRGDLGEPPSDADLDALMQRWGPGKH